MTKQSATPLELQKILIDHLQNRHCFDHEILQFQIIETHISWVVLTGHYAYKIKKSINFGFLDYSTLEKRKTQCEKELRLNRRTSPEIYIEVVSVGGTVTKPLISSKPTLEYLLKMHQFPQHSLLSHIVITQKFCDQHAISLAQILAQFHSKIEIASSHSVYGDSSQIITPIRENFSQIRAHIDNPQLLERLLKIEIKTEQQFQYLAPYFIERKQNGYIRDCHGDLHLNNIFLVNEQPRLFDCIEFNPALRIIDVMSELAFLVMDLEEHGETLRANLLLNRYLEISGDYEGVRLLPFYLCYRAMVRAKVTILQLKQSDIVTTPNITTPDEFNRYINMAECYSVQQDPQIIITHGLSGSGKTTITTKLMQQLGAIRIRSDIERKRLHGLTPDEESGLLNIYTDSASLRTYQQLAKQASAIIAGNYPVIIDATFLKQSERERFHILAEELKVSFTILAIEAPVETLQKRIKERIISGKDASEADLNVLKWQQKHCQPLSKNERPHTITINSESTSSVEAAYNQLSTTT
ncbi:MAG: AAA family ATPase [Chromatiales bacterium]|nr:AAA family ATPase [Chromatiales bacterium]